MQISYEEYLPGYWRHENLRPNAIRRLRSVIDQVDDMDDLIRIIVEHADIANAVGQQLDIIGFEFGVSRTIFLQGKKIQLNDTDFRFLIRGAIVKNRWDGTMKSMQDLCYEHFPGSNVYFEDNMNMSYSCIMTGVFTVNQRDMILENYIIPHPQGVAISYVLSAPVVVEKINRKTGPYAIGKHNMESTR